MKKIILTITLIASGLMASAQVGVGTENPQTSLHIVGANATDKGTSGTNAPGALAATDGITVPVVTTEMTAPGTPVNGTKVGQMVYSTFAGKTGFYFWNGTAWAAVGGAAQQYQNIRGGVETINAAATISNNSYFVIFNAASTSDITMPTPALGKTLWLKNVSASGVNANVLNVILGTTPAALSIGTGRMRCFVSDGTNWYASNQ